MATAIFNMSEAIPIDSLLNGLDAHLGLLWEEYEHLVRWVVVMGNQD